MNYRATKYSKKQKSGELFNWFFSEPKDNSNHLKFVYEYKPFINEVINTDDLPYGSEDATN